MKKKSVLIFLLCFFPFISYGKTETKLPDTCHLRFNKAFEKRNTKDMQKIFLECFKKPTPVAAYAEKLKKMHKHSGKNQTVIYAFSFDVSGQKDAFEGDTFFEITVDSKAQKIIDVVYHIAIK